MAAVKKIKTYKDSFERHGLVLSQIADNQWTGDCPFCFKEDHFYCNSKTGQWDCKSCSETGNLVTFLTKMAEVYKQDMPENELKRLARLRRLPVKAFLPHGFGFDGANYVLPIWSEQNTVRDIRWYNGEHMMSTEKCNVQLFGMPELAASQPQQRVWICEGEWDAIALKWLLGQTPAKDDIVVALPGSASIQDRWVDYLMKHECILCFDNDDAGDKGAIKTAIKLGKGRKKFLCWPETMPNGWDLNNQISEWWLSRVPPNHQLNGLMAMLSDKHRHDFSPEIGAPRVAPEDFDPGTFEDVLNAFRRWVKMSTDFINGIAISLATCLANDVPGDPLWLYLVGPPASGKTLILVSLASSPRTHFESTFTAPSLVSGFNTHPDPSLLPQLNGLCAVFKDGTELLTIHPDARREAYSTLRGAYDGSVSRPYGNGVRREYRDLHFNMLIGVTPAIHGDSQATMGERFLKFEMREKSEEINDKIRQAISNLEHKKEMEEDLANASARFLEKKVDPLAFKPIPEKWMVKLISLAQLLSLLRAQVERENYGDRDVKYRPTHESGTRVAIQLAKLGKLLTVVFGVEEIDARIYSLMRRVAMDSSIGYHVDIVRCIVKAGNPGLTATQLCELAGMNRGQISKKLEDLEQLRIVFRRRGEKRPRERGAVPHFWYLSATVVRLWNDSLVGDPNAAGQNPRTVQ